MSYDSEIINSMQSQASTGLSALSQPGRNPIRSSLVVAATGLGKTVIMGGLAKSWPTGRVMMISHRFELNQQSVKSFSHICGEEVDLEQAGYRADQRTNLCRIVVASVQTLNSYQRKIGQHRFERFDPMEFGLLMIDEAHRSAAVSYRKVVNHFRKNPDLCVIGVTATPDRLDGVGMGCVFESTACDLNLLWGVQNGWLVAPKQVFVQIDGLDLSQIRTVGGDLDEKQLAKMVEQEQNLHAMAAPIVETCGQDKQCIVFTASVAQAHRLAEMIRDYHERLHGTTTNAVSLVGSLNPQDPKRRQIVSDFKNGEIQYLANCGVATEGFDAPNVKVVAIGRPTKSRALYLQMLGRGTRPIPGTVDVDGMSTADRLEAIKSSSKPHCTVMDFVGQAGRHKLVCSTDFMLGNDAPEIKERANRISSQKDFDGSILDAIKQAKEELEAENEARRAKITTKIQWKAVEQATSYDVSTIPFSYKTRFYKGAVSEKQAALMLKLGYTQSQIEGMTKQKATEAIDYAIKNPITSTGRWIKNKKELEARNQLSRLDS